MPTCYTLIGPPGSGKTTWRERNLRAMHLPEVISTDDYLEEIAREQGITYSMALSSMNYGDLVAKCRVRIARAVIDGRDLILDQTNFTVGRRKLFRKSIPSHYEMVGVIFEVDRDTLVERIQQRERETGKHIPLWVLDKALREMEPPLPGEFNRIIRASDQFLA